MRIAVIGSGISGLGCAHVLGSHHDVVLFEADDRLGGHSNTVEVEDPMAGPLGVDTGFIVHNDRNYPNLIRLFDELGIMTVESEMSFAVTDRATNLCYRATNPNTLFADRWRILDPAMWRMLYDIARFYRQGRRLLAEVGPDMDPAGSPTVGRLLADGGYSESFVQHHLVPMGAAVWSADPDDFLEFPAVSLLRFLDNHGLLSIGDRPQWRTVAGGSRRYVSAIARRFQSEYGNEIRLGCPVTDVVRHRTRDGGDGRTGVTVISGRPGAQRSERFDHVVFAAHSDQALRILSDAGPDEKRRLAAVRYQPNRALLHLDTSVMPPNRRAWAAWNYEQVPGHDGSASITYDLTCLMRLPGSRRYLVSLNADERVDPALVLADFDYAHPVFDHAAVAAQAEIAAANGTDNTWFCGAWMGYGFHEDGFVSALRVCSGMGIDWR